MKEFVNNQDNSKWSVAVIPSAEGYSAIQVSTEGDNIETEVSEFISKLINEKLDFVKERGMGAIGPLMGPVMSEFRGKMDGSRINELLIKEIKGKI